MPKRKSGGDQPFPTPSLSSLDAALDLLACETLSRLASLTSKFESAAGVKLNDGVIKHRWEEACMRYWLMKSMDDLSCNGSGSSKDGELETNGDSAMADDDGRPAGHYDRPLPKSSHPGAVATFELDAEDAQAWKSWSPKINDTVLCQLPGSLGFWPGKIIDRKVCLQGRTIPRGNHFYAVRIYNPEIEPTISIKARMVPLSLRPTPPLMASTELLSAYNHASNPTTFDMEAAHRESAAAHTRTHPGVGDDELVAMVKEQKAEWNKFVNWIMDERRIEKLRALMDERDRRLKAVTQESTELEGFGEVDAREEKGSRKRRVTHSEPSIAYISTAHKIKKVDGNPNERGGIFKVTPSASSSPISAPPTPSNSRNATPMSSYIRPALSAPYRASSPRRAERRRNGVFTTVGDFSPRGRGGTYTPPRVLPTGDETAPFGSPSPAPSLKKFDFVSPLGPVKFGKLSTDIDDDTIMLSKNAIPGSNLEAVLEEEEDGSWTVVTGRRQKRAGSAPVEQAEKSVLQANASDDIALIG